VSASRIIRQVSSAKPTLGRSTGPSNPSRTPHQNNFKWEKLILGWFPFEVIDHDYLHRPHSELQPGLLFDAFDDC
jgi:hypothetical protein